MAWEAVVGGCQLQKWQREAPGLKLIPHCPHWMVGSFAPFGFVDGLLPDRYRDQQPNTTDPNSPKKRAEAENQISDAPKLNPASNWPTRTRD